MPVTALEKLGSRTGERGRDDQDELLMILSGSDDEAELYAALAAETPTDRGALKRTGIRLVEQLGAKLWEGAAYYEKAEATGGKETGEEAFSFTTAGGTQNLIFSKRGTPVAAYAVAGGTVPLTYGMIGVNGDQVEGVDVGLSAFDFEIVKYVAPEDITKEYFRTLFLLSWHTNAAKWATVVDGVPFEFEAGEVLFQYVTGGKRGRGDWELTFKFSALPNKTGLTVGDITGIAKKGWEYLWCQYDTTDGGTGTGKALVRKPRAVFIEQVYDAGNFTLLNVGTVAGG